jgi:hypothetical protein
MQPRKHETTKKTFGTQRPLSPQRRFLCHAAIALTDDHRRARRKRRGEANRFDAAPRSGGTGIANRRFAVRATTACYAGRSASNQILRAFVPSCLRGFVFFVFSCFRVFVVAFVIGIAACVS